MSNRPVSNGFVRYGRQKMFSKRYKAAKTKTGRLIPKKNILMPVTSRWTSR